MEIYIITATYYGKKDIFEISRAAFKTYLEAKDELADIVRQFQESPEINQYWDLFDWGREALAFVYFNNGKKYAELSIKQLILQ